MKYKVIIFDWDGTLMDSVGKIVECIQDSARHLGLPVPTSNEAKQVIGLSLVQAMQQLFALPDIKSAEKVADQYKYFSVRHYQESSPLFDGVVELLTRLKSKGYKLAVATGKGRKGLNQGWQHSNTKQFFDSSRCADDAQSKPSPDMLQQILAELNIEPHQALMVGDTSYDMAMAESIGMDRVGVSFGVHDKQTLNQHAPIAIIDSIGDLLEFI
ncbi:HAD-IA family hydrolase [Paraglaciecola aquimarina]|uniref:HAD-IA family hydrolase n=1 Tax=Paraglaciecola algarum TaxID=3050085 RepID=A0ABS9DBR7_9ALTE|nr:HAD-IA family hydrolase [Paraglaciecola sp. G1-23]MCF2950401.1 HAD-IA family hydrolase [Paraglaciecola sp. G1-23]